MTKKISIVTPAYNEEENLEELSIQLNAVFEQLPKYEFEVIIVDNGSTDGTWEKIEAIKKKDWRYRGLQLSRNFTAPGGITAGLQYATGDAAIVMCADLQDPPAKIPEFIKKWEQGYDVVFHLVSERQGVSKTRAVLSDVFHGLMEKLTNDSYPRNASVFRLMDRVAYTTFNRFSETNRYFPGLCNWMGFKAAGLRFARTERFAGESKASLGVVLRLALNGIFSFSYMPLRLVTIFGIGISVSSFLYLSYLLVSILIFGRQTIPGLASLIALTLLLFGFLFLAIGIIGEYLARVYEEVKGRPNFIVRQSVGFSSPEKSAPSKEPITTQPNSPPWNTTIASPPPPSPPSLI